MNTTKLDDILDDFGHAVVNNKHSPRTLVRKPTKQQIKALMLELVEQTVPNTIIMDKVRYQLREAIQAL